MNNVDDFRPLIRGPFTHLAGTVPVFSATEVAMAKIATLRAFQRLTGAAA